MKLREHASAQETRDFYELDMSRRVQGRLRGNQRIERAAAFVVPRIPIDAHVLEIGCGIGILTERIAKRAKKGKVLAVDISPVHIDYCKLTVSNPNVQFACVDMLDAFGELMDSYQDKIDVVVASDVIEHLPREKCIQLFRNLSRVMSRAGRILLTYPSPEYQQHLYQQHDSRLQAIDLIIEVEDILQFSAAAECSLRGFAYQDVWMRDQYIHCELARAIKVIPYAAKEDERLSPWMRKWEWVKRKGRGLWTILTAPARYRKYVTSPRNKMRH